MTSQEPFMTHNVPKISVSNHDENDQEMNHIEKPDQARPKQPNSARLAPKRTEPRVKHPDNPYSNISSYSHEATTVPPYVLYGIANSGDKEQSARKIYDRSGQVGSTMQDPFLNSLNNNWGTFFETVDSTPAYSEGILTNDLEALKELPDLSGRWGGDARLKSYLNNDHTDLNEFEKQKQLGHVYESSSNSSYNKDNFKSKSKAGYWMSTETREEWGPYVSRLLLSNNYLPLFFRILMMVLSVIALAISVNIFKLSRLKAEISNFDGFVSISQQPSTIMAICVQSVALVYLFYITYDEFYSKPLGIRNPVEKMRLILLDLLFIIFSSANISLAFNTLYDSQWLCLLDATGYPKRNTICSNQRALSAFLFLILVMWVITFSISIMRVIQKVSSPGT